MSQRVRRLTAAARAVLPEGTFVVGAGLVIVGLSAYGFQILAFRRLSEHDYNALNALWVFVFVLAPGFFLPLEQEVGRAMADRRARNIGGGPVARRAALAGAALTIALAVVTIAAALGTPIVDDLFAGHTGLVACLGIAIVTYCTEHLTRGVLAGAARFGPYGFVLGAEGAIRLAPVVVLWAAGVDDPVYYGLCLAIPPAIASLLALRGQRGLLAPGPDAPWSELSTNLGYLLFGSLFAQALSYAPFLGVQVLKTAAESKQASNFIVGLYLARIPILLFQAVQAALLPKLAHLAGAGREDDFRMGLRRLLTVVIGIAVVGVIAAGTIGPPVGEVLFGHKFNLEHEDLALLAAGAGLFIIALTLAQALIALLGHSRPMGAWIAGLCVFVIVTSVSTNDLFLRVELGSAAGAGASVAVMAYMLAQRLRAGISGDSLRTLVTQIEHEPLEI